jgi:hypothetical protein
MSDEKVIRIRALIKPGEKHRNFNVFPGETDYLNITGMATTN